MIFPQNGEMTPFQCNKVVQRRVVYPGELTSGFGCRSHSDPAVQHGSQLFSSGIRLQVANGLLPKLNHEIMSCDWVPQLTRQSAQAPNKTATSRNPVGLGQLSWVQLQDSVATVSSLLAFRHRLHASILNPPTKVSVCLSWPDHETENRQEPLCQRLQRPRQEQVEKPQPLH